jgi:hypothetical protein
MIYSVWDHARRAYDYYDAPDMTRDAATSAPAPSHIRSDRLGATPEGAAWPLPPGAKKTGSGKYPRGMIASRNGGGGMSGLGLFEITPTNIVLWAALGFVVWKFVLPEMGRRHA